MLHSHSTGSAISSARPGRGMAEAAPDALPSSSPAAIMRSTIGVSMVPRHTAFTLIPWLPSSTQLARRHRAARGPVKPMTGLLTAVPADELRAIPVVTQGGCGSTERSAPASPGCLLLLMGVLIFRALSHCCDGASSGDAAGVELRGNDVVAVLC